LAGAVLEHPCAVCHRPVAIQYFVHDGDCLAAWKREPGVRVLAGGRFGGPWRGTCLICNRWVEPPRMVHEGACEDKWLEAQQDMAETFWPAMVVSAVVIGAIIALAIFLN
jgi:hypothetical protein